MTRARFSCSSEQAEGTVRFRYDRDHNKGCVDGIESGEWYYATRARVHGEWGLVLCLSHSLMGRLMY